MSPEFLITVQPIPYGFTVLPLFVSMHKFFEWEIMKYIPPTAPIAVKVIICKPSFHVLYAKRDISISCQYPYLKPSFDGIHIHFYIRILCVPRLQFKSYRHGNFLNQGFFLAIFLHIIEREKLAKVRKFKDCQVFCLVSRTTVSTCYKTHY